MLRTRRAYEPAARGDGYRVLVERLWPRGVRKSDLPLDEWLKDVAPSSELRRWYGHDPERWPEFRRRYLAELRAAPAAGALRELADRAGGGTVTLVYSAHDAQHSGAAVLKGAIERRISHRPSRRVH